MLPSYLFKTNVKINEKCNAKSMQSNGIWNYTAKGYLGNNLLFNLPYFTFWLPFTKW